MLRKLSLIVFLGLMGCAAVDPEPAWQNVRTLNASRTKSDPVWVRTPEEAAVVDEAVDLMLKDGLNREEALRIAVLKNMGLQARFADLGVSAATVVEASLPTNPTLDGWLGLPGRSGASSLGLLAWLSDLWIIPARTAVAELAMKRTEYVVATDIMQTGMMAASAWDRLVAARRELTLAKDLLRLHSATMKRISIRFDHGLDETAMVQESVAMVAEQRVAIQSAMQTLTEAQTSLAQILATSEAWMFVPQGATLVATPSSELDINRALETGMSDRLDLYVRRVEVERAASAVGLENALIWRSVGVGVTKEGQFARVQSSNVDADEVFGPTISIEIPIFNQNQAGRAAASYELQRAINLLGAARMRATKEITDAFQRYKNTFTSLGNLEAVVRPAILARLQYLREWNGKMQVPFLEVLAAEARLVMVDMEIVRVREDRNNSWRELEFAIKGGAK